MTRAAAMAISEQIIRDLMREHPELPIRASFYRGINHGNTWNPINEDITQTNAVTGGWFVLLKPTLDDVVLSAWEPNILGGGIIGGLGNDAEVSPVHYPRAGAEIDLSALVGDAFRGELLAAVREKVAVIEQARAAA